MVTEWEGKKIIYPDDMVFTLWGQDTLDYSLPRVDYTIVSYVDSVGCMSCKLQLLKCHISRKVIQLIKPIINIHTHRKIIFIKL